MKQPDQSKTSREERPSRNKRVTGTLVRIHEKGYGFIRPTNPALPEHYVNVTDFVNRADWFEGNTVSFVSGPAKPGKAPPAISVKIAGRSTKTEVKK